jgi:hypothetical protein
MKTRYHDQQNKSSNRFFTRLRFSITVIFYAVLIVATMMNLNPTAPDDPDVQPISAENYSESNWQIYKEIIEMHDQYQEQFDSWRKIFATHAKTVARLIKTFPGSANINESRLSEIISSYEDNPDADKTGDVFAPWTNRWSGEWSNGAQQYHIWETTIISGNRMIQPVTLSENTFINSNSVRKMVNDEKTDIAINIFSQKYGITGWVSKYQHGRYELPHIGYLINETTLLWITQIKEPGNLAKDDSRWFVFLETVNSRENPTEYRIYGQPVIIDNEPIVEAGQRDKHQGIYYAAGSNNNAIAAAVLDFPNN